MKFHNPTYREHLNSPYWRNLRQRIWERAKGYCERCGFPPIYAGNLELHHVTYDNFPCECDEDVELLCKFCHAEETRKQVLKKATVCEVRSWGYNVWKDTRPRRPTDGSIQLKFKW